MMKDPRYKGYKVIGTTWDGVKILQSKTKPVNFTRKEIKHIVAKVLKEERYRMQDQQIRQVAVDLANKADISYDLALKIARQAATEKWKSL